MINEWVKNEMGNISFGDKRLNLRLMKVLSKIAEQPQSSLPQIFKGHAESLAAYRLFSNDLVNEEAVIAPHIANTHARAKLQPVVLSLSDTTSLNYTTRKSHPDTGYISSNNAQGFFLHATIAITPERLHLGIVDQQFWSREKEKSVPIHREYRNFEDRESYKWYKAYLSSCKLAESLSDTKVVHVTDREGDVFEIFEEWYNRSSEGNSPPHLLIRSNHNRVLYSGKKRVGRLYDQLEKSPKLGEFSFEVEDRGSGVKRKVKQSVHAMPIELRSRYGADRPNVDIAINAVYIKEEDPPEESKGITWCLLTTLPISCLEEIKTVVEYYLCRWEIETFFKTLKSGCKVEEKSLRSAERLFPLFSLFLIIAWRINFLMQVSRVLPEVSCESFFEPSEWKSGYAVATKNRLGPPQPPTMGEMMKYIAILGGYKERKNGQPPGVKTIWKGLCALANYSEAWDIFGPEVRKTKNEISVKKTYV